MLILRRPRVDELCDRCGEPLVQRSDDQPDAIETRLKVYDEQTAPLVRYYDERRLVASDGCFGCSGCRLSASLEGAGTVSGDMIILKTPDEIAVMAQASRVVAEALQILKKAVRPGITTDELDRLAEEEIRIPWCAAGV